MNKSASLEIVRDKVSVRSLANWVLQLAQREGLPITNMALNKLVYFLVEKVLIERRRLITDAKIEAWEHGPVFRELYQQFKVFGEKPISEKARYFDISDGELKSAVPAVPADLSAELEAFIRPLLPWSAARLRALSHVIDGPWHRVWAYDGFANPGMEITPEKILDRGEADG